MEGREEAMRTNSPYARLAKEWEEMYGARARAIRKMKAEQGS